MRKITAYCLNIFLIVFLAFGISGASEAVSNEVQNGDAASILRDKALSFFLPMTGKVESVEAGRVIVRADDNAELQKGARLSLFREGELFYHPVTKEPVGKTEEFIGAVEVTGREGGEGIYACKPVSGEAAAGDIVRFTSSKVKLAFFQEKEADWSLSEAFFSSLKDSGRFEILEKGLPASGRSGLLSVLKESGADAAILLSTPVNENKKFLKAELFWPGDSSPFADISAEASAEYINELTRYEDFMAASLADKEPWNSYELDSGYLFAIGDINGDKLNELVVSDGSVIKIYNMKNEPQEIWSLKGSARERHISLDLLDLNGNGRDEIFVTSVVNEESPAFFSRDSGTASVTDTGRASSYVLEFEHSEGYRKISGDLPYFLRASSGTLLMQRFDEKEILSSPVYTGKWNGKSYEADKRLDLPSGVNIYGFAYVDWKNDGNVYLIAVNDGGFLTMYKNNAAVWQSGETYGKPAISFKKSTNSFIKPDTEWLIRGRLIAVNTDRGQKVIAVRKKAVLSKVPRLGSFSAEVYALSWDNGAMNEELLLQGVTGAVSDYAVDGRKIYLMAKSGIFTMVKNGVKGEFARTSILYYYNFEEK
ncbi:MAG: VCBS repeat-containing protein [Nitrospirae bacterium]|nr:VCBS repeat-containing protein [Nitrospirota bacterium]